MYRKGAKLLVILLILDLILSPLTGFATSNKAGTKRISGNDRYETAVAISQKGWKTSDYAVLARGDDFADALCAGPLAKKYEAPILLTQTQELNQATLSELKRLKVKHVFIVGGIGAISQSIENELSSEGFSDIERLSGQSRYETSVKIAEKIGTNGQVALATGNDFPDALSFSVIASKLQIPILLTAKNSLPASVDSYFQANTVTKTYVVGGIGVIGSDVENNVSHPFRLAGNDRYETNKVILQYFENNLNFDNIYVAIGGGSKGNEFADALTGAALAAKNASPLVLVSKILPANTENYLKSKISLATKVKGLGGEQVVPSAVLQKIISLKENVPVAQKYSEAGTFGPEEGTETIEGDVIISSRDVTLQNTIITGDLLLAESIGDGEVTLNNITVEGKTIINGGGPNSVIMYNFNGQTVMVDVPDGSNVRLVAQGNTSVADVQMESDGSLEEDGVTGEGFTTVYIPEGAAVVLSGDFGDVNVEAANADVNIENGSINNLNIAENAIGSNITLSHNTSVATLNANAQSNVNSQGRITTANINAENTNISGQGQITRANINASNTSIEREPGTTNIEEGVTTNIGGEEQTGDQTSQPTGGGGGGGGGGGSADSTAPSVSTYAPLDNATDIAIGANLVLTFSENIQAAAGKNIVIKKTTDDSVVATIAADDAKVTVSGTIVTINPASDLENNTEYYVLIDAGAFKDAAGNNYAGISSTTAWSFTTELAPAVLSSLEENLTANFNPGFSSGVYNYDLEADYGETSLDLTATLDGATIKYSYGATSNKTVASGAAETITLNIGENVISIVVEKPLHETSTYVITVNRSTPGLSDFDMNVGFSSIDIEMSQLVDGVTPVNFSDLYSVLDKDASTLRFYKDGGGVPDISLSLNELEGAGDVNFNTSTGAIQVTGDIELNTQAFANGGSFENFQVFEHDRASIRLVKADGGFDVTKSVAVPYLSFTNTVDGSNLKISVDGNQAYGNVGVDPLAFLQAFDITGTFTNTNIKAATGASYAEAKNAAVPIGDFGADASGDNKIKAWYVIVADHSTGTENLDTFTSTLDPATDTFTISATRNDNMPVNAAITFYIMDETIGTIEYEQLRLVGMDAGTVVAITPIAGSGTATTVTSIGNPVLYTVTNHDTLMDKDNNTITAGQISISTATKVGQFLTNLTKEQYQTWKVTTAANVPANATVFGTAEAKEPMTVLQAGDVLTVLSADWTTIRSYAIDVKQVDAANSQVTDTTPENPRVGQQFTFAVSVRDAANVPISGLIQSDFTVTEDGGGNLTVTDVSEDGITGNYTVTAIHDTVETMNITTNVSGVEAGVISNVAVQSPTSIFSASSHWSGDNLYVYLEYSADLMADLTNVAKSQFVMENDGGTVIPDEILAYNSNGIRLVFYNYNLINGGMKNITYTGDGTQSNRLQDSEGKDVASPETMPVSVPYKPQPAEVTAGATAVKSATQDKISVTVTQANVLPDSVKNNYTHVYAEASLSDTNSYDTDAQIQEAIFASYIDGAAQRKTVEQAGVGFDIDAAWGAVPYDVLVIFYGPDTGTPYEDVIGYMVINNVNVNL